MISEIISVIIGTMHEVFKDTCKNTVQYNEYNICLINNYIKCIILFYIYPCIVIKIIYNANNDNFNTALFYLFVFLTLIFFI